MKTLDKLNQHECKCLLVTFSDKQKKTKERFNELNLNKRARSAKLRIIEKTIKTK